MGCAAAEILSTHGEKPIQAFLAFFDVICPGLGKIVIGDPCDISGKYILYYTTEEFGGMIDEIEQADLSCDEAKAGFQIQIYLLPDLNQVTW